MFPSPLQLGWWVEMIFGRLIHLSSGKSPWHVYFLLLQAGAHNAGRRECVVTWSVGEDREGAPQHHQPSTPASHRACSKSPFTLTELPALCTEGTLVLGHGATVTRGALSPGEWRRDLGCALRRVAFPPTEKGVMLWAISLFHAPDTPI